MTLPLGELIYRLPKEIFREVKMTPGDMRLITGIVLDSRQVQPGNLFVALSGGSTNGHDYIPGAIEKGASAIIGTQRIPEINVPYLMVADSRLALALCAAAFYDFPAKRLTVIGVTGTDGKTTTSNLIFSILKNAGLHTGMITTVNAVVGDQAIDTGFHVTTPEAPEIQKYLAQMVNLQPLPITHVVLESTSHGLAQKRVAACEFDIGVVTNITHEHIDYHGSFEEYRAAKSILFDQLAETALKPGGNPRLAILNRDDDSCAFLSRHVSELQPGVRQIEYGIQPGSTVTATDISQDFDGLSFNVVGRNYSVPIKTKLFGKYNIYNCLAAWSTTVEGLNISIDRARAGIQAMDGIPGRMERIDIGQSFLAFVDFAHTPNALLEVLKAARLIASPSSKIITVLGSAGLRDKVKRRLMAEISVQYADRSIFTAEDPRSESLKDILNEMNSGAELYGEEGNNYYRIPDRRIAIRYAVKLASPGDLVLALGKGHEQSMCFGNIEYPWDDRIAMRVAIAELLGMDIKMEMPYLPEQ